jgi:outer membrane lipoprotein SlyB
VRKFILMLAIFPLIANAGYQRNVARPVDNVVYGHIDSVRYLSEPEVETAQSNGMDTFIGVAAGGVIGHQLVRGRGQTLATIIGSIAGASVAQNYSSQSYRQYQPRDRLVELLIATDKGELVDVIQDVDPSMLFSKTDKVRILYFSDGVRVDKEY